MEVNYMECIENHKEYKNIDEQIRYLYDSKKIVVDKEDEHWFVDVNYITLINPYKEIFATGKIRMETMSMVNIQILKSF